MLSRDHLSRLRKCGEELKRIDESRNELIDDLLRQLNDVQKTMDSNAFVMVLIDGDSMNVRTSCVLNVDLPD